MSSLSSEKMLGMSLDDLIASEKKVDGGAKKFARAFNINKESSGFKREGGDWKDRKSGGSWKDKDWKDKEWKEKEWKDRDWKDKDWKSKDWKVHSSARVVLRDNKSSKSDETAVRVTNIPYDLTWRDVKEAFQSVGDIHRCDVENGVATIVFAHYREALQAVKTYDGGDMNGRIIRASLA